MIKFLPQEMQDAIDKATSSGDYSDPAYVAAETEYMLRHAAGEVTEDSPECLRRPVKKGGEAYVVGWGPERVHTTGNFERL